MYLDEFPQGKFRVLAQLKIKRLQRKSVPIQTETSVPAGFIRIKPGTFRMGSDSGYSYEKPVHPVRISKAFDMSDHEVTVGEYRKFVNASGHRSPNQCDYGQKYNNWDKGQENHPVNCVSWDDAQAYISWLNQQGNISYRLCTEAEWEYAARVGTTSKWSCGNNESCLQRHAWYELNAWKVTNKGTRSVKTKQPNPWCLYDMHGNVWEWVQDKRCSYAQELDSNAQRQCTSSSRVLRGGSFHNTARLVRSAVRYSGSPGIRYDFLGLRLCSSFNP